MNKMWGPVQNFIYFLVKYGHGNPNKAFHMSAGLPTSTSFPCFIKWKPYKTRAVGQIWGDKRQFRLTYKSFT